MFSQGQMMHDTVSAFAVLKMRYLNIGNFYYKKTCCRYLFLKESMSSALAQICVILALAPLFNDFQRPCTRTAQTKLSEHVLITDRGHLNHVNGHQLRQAAMWNLWRFIRTCIIGLCLNVCARSLRSIALDH